MQLVWRRKLIVKARTRLDAATSRGTSLDIVQGGYQQSRRIAPSLSSPDTRPAMSTPAASPSRSHPNYHYLGQYDHARFQRAFHAQFAGSGRFNAAAVPDLLALLGLIERDPAVDDVRKAAYLLATVMWETTSPTVVSHTVVDRRGRPVLDRKKRPIVVKRRRWLMTMAPVSEVGEGKGRRYHDPVKVQGLPDGSVRITEQDGDQFVVFATGAITKLTPGARMGSAAGAPVAQAYEDDDGAGQAYFGRGYVQLTWWSNYATAGVAIGRGLDLLLDPELVRQPAVAYAIMSHGMTNGSGFANGHRFANYFNGPSTDYAGARRMVNGSDHARDIAAIAVKFEAALMTSRATAAPARPAIGAVP